MPPARARAAACGALLALATLPACQDPFALPDATVENVVDTLSVWAVSGTALHLPSAYAVDVRRAVRPDAGAGFDFVFEMDAAGQAQLLPTGAIDLGRSSGVLLATQPFDSITVAPVTGYQDSLAVAVGLDDVAIIRSRPVQCFFQTIEPLYAKLRVLTIDPAERRMDFEVLANVNCGYRGLEPGLPTR
jgi:hypothetical protein